MPNLNDYIDDASLARLIDTARREDLGPNGIDATSACFVAEDAVGEAAFVNREAGVIAGLSVLQTVCRVYGGGVRYALHHSDGDRAGAGTRLATIAGPMRDLLAIERVALNLMTHLSGVATSTAEYVARCEGTRARIYDTRKTLPGLRGLQKYAVVCGGGHTHRMGLYDAVLIKDNHLAGTPLSQLSAKLDDSADRARRVTPGLKFVMVEVDSLDQLGEVLKASIDIVLLDNMPLSTLTQAVAMRNQHAPKIELEASGGVTLGTVGNIAKTGVDRISVGALTHSVVSLDIGLDIA
ncbi:MAG: carboxylating nicotinate-nucleotide diphosphorylase [Phycisphaeraceae bacterium]